MRKVFLLLGLGVMGCVQTSQAQTVKPMSSGSTPTKPTSTSVQEKGEKYAEAGEKYTYVILSAELSSNGDLLMKEPTQEEISRLKSSMEANPNNREYLEMYEAIADKSKGFSSLLNLYGKNGYELEGVIQPIPEMKQKTVSFILKKEN